MNMFDLPNRLAISELAYERLLQGEIPEGVATALKANVTSLQNLVDGSGGIAVAAAMGCATESVEALRRHIGREGAIGLLIGLAVAARVRE